MQELWLWIWLMIALKIPVIGACWLIWYAAHQTPGGQPIGGGDGGGGTRFDPGPRRRGPHDSDLGGLANAPRRRGGRQTDRGRPHRVAGARNVVNRDSVSADG